MLAVLGLRGLGFLGWGGSDGVLACIGTSLQPFLDLAVHESCAVCTAEPGMTFTPASCGCHQPPELMPRGGGSGGRTRLNIAPRTAAVRSPERYATVAHRAPYVLQCATVRKSFGWTGRPTAAHLPVALVLHRPVGTAHLPAALYPALSTWICSPFALACVDPAERWCRRSGGASAAEKPEKAFAVRQQTCPLRRK